MTLVSGKERASRPLAYYTEGKRLLVCNIGLKKVKMVLTGVGTSGSRQGRQQISKWCNVHQKDKHTSTGYALNWGIQVIECLALNNLSADFTANTKLGEATLGDDEP